MESLKILSSKSLYISLFYILCSTFLPAQWFQQTNGLPDNWYPGIAIDACDNETAVFSAGFDNYPNYHTRLFKTIDAGQTWVEIPIPNTGNSSLDISDLSLVDSTHLWICSGYNPGIFYTDNNGTTWEEQFSDTSLVYFINYIEMFDLNNGIAMGDARDFGAGPAIFLQTIDGGANWVSVNDSAFGGWSGDVWRRVDFVNPDVGYFFESGSNPQLLYKTIDGGYYWDALPYPTNYIQVLKFFNEDIGYIIDGIGSMYNTFDGGQTWTELNVPIDRWGIDIEFDPNSYRNVWFADLNSLWYMKDNGEVFVEQIHYTSSVPAGPIGFRDIVFTDSWNGWVLLDEGALFHTTNGGHSVIPEESSLPHNTETIGPFTLEFSIHDASGTWSGQKLFHYSVNDIQDSLELTLIPQDNIWYVNIPEFSGITGTTELRYWLSIEHVVGDMYLWPEGAPTNYNTMVFGPDTTAPVLAELSTQTVAHYLIPFEKEVRINAAWDDRFAIDTPVLHWRVNQDTGHSSSMVWIDSAFTDETWQTSWKGIVTGQTGNLHDTVYYWVTASDMSQNQNAGMSQEHYFTTALSEVIGDWEQAESYEDISLWTPFEDGEFYNYNSGEYQWGAVIKESMNVLDAFRDTLRYERRLDFSQVEEAWLKVPMIINFGQYNEGYLQASTNGRDWTNLDHYLGQVSPAVYQYDLSEYAGEDSVYFLFHVMHWDANLHWLIDDIVLHSDSAMVGLENDSRIADQFQLHQNHPNPFNPVTTIQYKLPHRSDVWITIYDLLGREVTTLVSEKQDAGYKSIQWDASNVASGMYFYQMRVYDPDAVGAGEYVQTRKMVVLK